MTSLVADGLFGLAPKAPPSYPAKTLLEEMYDQKAIKQRVFSMRLGFQGQESRLWLGGFDHEQIRASINGFPYGLRSDDKTPDQLESHINWVQQSSEFYWSTYLSSVQLN
jgi:hypothetical protein